MPRTTQATPGATSATNSSAYTSGTFPGHAADSRQPTELTAHQQQILRDLGVEQPSLFLQLAAGQQAEPAA